MTHIKAGMSMATPRDVVDDRVNQIEKDVGAHNLKLDLILKNMKVARRCLLKGWTKWT